MGCGITPDLVQFVFSLSGYYFKYCGQGNLNGPEGKTYVDRATKCKKSQRQDVVYVFERSAWGGNLDGGLKRTSRR